VSLELLLIIIPDLNVLLNLTLDGLRFAQELRDIVVFPLLSEEGGDALEFGFVLVCLGTLDGWRLDWALGAFRGSGLDLRVFAHGDIHDVVFFHVG